MRGTSKAQEKRDRRRSQQTTLDEYRYLGSTRWFLFSEIIQLRKKDLRGRVG